jgi:hypothetical protein
LVNFSPGLMPDCRHTFVGLNFNFSLVLVVCSTDVKGAFSVDGGLECNSESIPDCGAKCCDNVRDYSLCFNILYSISEFTLETSGLN